MAADKAVMTEGKESVNECNNSDNAVVKIVYLDFSPISLLCFLLFVHLALLLFLLVPSFGSLECSHTHTIR